MIEITNVFRAFLLRANENPTPYPEPEPGPPPGAPERDPDWCHTHGKKC